MIPLCKTDDMETAIRLLDRNFDRVLVNGIYKLIYPVRVRPKLLGDIYYGRNADRGAHEVQSWLRNGGTLLNYRRDVHVAHDVQVFCECPLSIPELLDASVETKVCAVVYRPPSWTPHYMELRRFFPTASDCSDFVATLSSNIDSRPTLDALHALGLPDKGVVAIYEPTHRLSAGIRKTILRGENDRAYCRITPIIPRVGPTDRSLLALYEAILQLPISGNVRLALNSTLYRASKKWRVQLKALARAGCVKVQPRIGFYILSKIKPDYDRIQRDHDKAVHELDRVTACVDRAPILTPVKVKSLLRSRQPIRQSRSVSAALPESSATSPDRAD